MTDGRRGGLVPPGGRRLLVAGGEDPLTLQIAEALGASPAVVACETWIGSGTPPSPRDRFHGLVYVAASRPGAGPGPALEDVDRWLELAAKAPPDQVVLVGSWAVLSPHHRHPGLVGEDSLAARALGNRVAASWRELEERARLRLPEIGSKLVVLRPAALPAAAGGDPLSAFFRGRLAITVAGYDPPVQLLDPEDLARAVRLAVERRPEGVFHLAPRGVAPLRRALALAGVTRIPLPLWGHLLVGGGGRRDYLRYSTTIGGDRAARELGFEPRFSTAETALRQRGAPARSAPEFDDFGHDPEVIARKGRRLQGFLHDHYWRVEVRGTEGIPPGRAVLVGLHRGFMPWDGVMAVHSVHRATGRYIRFLIHPTLVKFPFLFNLMFRLGGVIACRENAQRVLADGGLLGVFPEGIGGAFTYYRDAYRLHRFGRDQYVRMALRNRAPLVPFVTLGSAETFPILAKLEWKWWRRFSEWPCLPLTPTFPLLPVPLPSKWHTLFLEPIHVEREQPPEAADDPQVVAAISDRVRQVLERTLLEMKDRRRSIFHGSIFDSGPAREGL